MGLWVVLFLSLSLCLEALVWKGLRSTVPSRDGVTEALDGMMSGVQNGWDTVHTHSMDIV